MTIQPFPRADRNLIAQAEDLLEECFPHAYGGDLARQQMALCLEEDRIALMAAEGDRLIGFVGAIPQYGVTGWELHPLAVTGSRRGRADTGGDHQTHHQTDAAST